MQHCAGHVLELQATVSKNHNYFLGERFIVPMDTLYDEPCCKKGCLTFVPDETVQLQREYFRDKTLQEQEAWLMETMGASVAGEGSMQMRIGQHPVCNEGWMKALGVTRARFYVIKKKVLSKSF